VIATVWPAIGPAASSAAPLIAEELADTRRLDNRTPGLTSDAVDKDLELIDLVNAAPAAVG
jgi:hypothetical protein